MQFLLVLLYFVLRWSESYLRVMQANCNDNHGQNKWEVKRQVLQTLKHQKTTEIYTDEPLSLKFILFSEWFRCSLRFCKVS